MELTKETNWATVIVVFLLTVIVFVLDLRTPSDIAAWTLYSVPLGLTRRSHLKHLTVSLAVVCTALIILAHIFSVSVTEDIAAINRILSIVMVWVFAFFLK